MLLVILLITVAAAAALFWHGESQPTGAIVTRAQVVRFTTGTCNLTFTSGWNLFSIPCAPFEGYAMEGFQALLAGNMTSIHAYVASDTSDPWKAYNPSLPSWVTQDLTKVGDTRGYWINMEGDGRFDVSTIITSPRSIAVSPGWNLVGYPSKSPKRVNESLATLYPNWRELRFWNSTDSSYYAYYNSTQSGDFTNQTPYNGYWLYMSAAGTWVITW